MVLAKNYIKTKEVEKAKKTLTEGVSVAAQKGVGVLANQMQALLNELV